MWMHCVHININSFTITQPMEDRNDSKTNNGFLNAYEPSQVVKADSILILSELLSVERYYFW